MVVVVVDVKETRNAVAEFLSTWLALRWRKVENVIANQIQLRGPFQTKGREEYKRQNNVCSSILYSYIRT